MKLQKLAHIAWMLFFGAWLVQDVLDSHYFWLPLWGVGFLFSIAAVAASCRDTTPDA